MTTDTATVEPSSAGLLDSVQVTDETNAANPQAAEIDHKAPAPAADQPLTVPGTPKTRPEYLPENFWDGEKGEANYEALAKSWSDMRKIVSQGRHKAPADGKYDLKAFGEGAENNPIASTLVNWAKERGIGQEDFDQLVTGLQTQSKELMQADQIDPAKELAQLGPNANAMINGMVDWARGMVKKGIWGADDFEEFKVMGGTAKGLRALMKVREAYEGRIPIESQPMEGAPSKEELYAMVADPKYKTDAAYRQKVEKLFKAVIPD